MRKVVLAIHDLLMIYYRGSSRCSVKLGMQPPYCSTDFSTTIKKPW